MDVDVRRAGSVRRRVLSTLVGGLLAGGLAAGSVSAAQPDGRDASAPTPAPVRSVIVGSGPSTPAVSPDGSRLYVTHVTSSRTGAVAVIDAATMRVVARVPVPMQPEWPVLSPDGTRLYVTSAGGDAGSLSVIDTGTNAVVASLPLGLLPARPVISADGTRVFVSDPTEASVQVVDTATNTAMSPIDVGDYPETGVLGTGDQYRPNTTTLYVPNRYDGTVSVIDTTRNSIVATVNVGKKPTTPAAAPGLAVVGNQVYVPNQAVRSATGTSSVSVINTGSNRVTRTLLVGRCPVTPAVSPDGARLYVHNVSSGTLSVVDTESNRVRATIPLGRKARCDTLPVPILNPDGTLLFVPNAFDEGLSVVDTATRSVEAILGAGSGEFSPSLSPDGRIVYVPDGNNGSVTAFDVSARPWPTAPVAATARTKRTSAVVSWRPPATAIDDGVTRYSARAFPGGLICVSSGTSCRIAGLRRGTRYTFSVRAGNDVALGPAATTSARTR